MAAHVRAADAPEDLRRCHECGWTYPNHHPSAKHRRNHKKQCGKLPGFSKTTDLKASPQLATGSSDEGSSDEEHHRLSHQAQEKSGHHQELSQSPSPAAAANVEQVSRSLSDVTQSDDGGAAVKPKDTEETGLLSSRDIDLSTSKDVAETANGSDQSRSRIGSAHAPKGQWICRHCGWAYPNAHPSAKNRRKHKKICGIAASLAGPGGSSDEASSDEEKSCGNASNARMETEEPLECISSGAEGSLGAERTNGASAEAIDLSQVVEGQALTDVPKEVPLKPDSSISQVPFGATHMHGVSGSNGLEKLDVGDSQVAQVDDGSSPPNDVQAPSTPGSLGAERTNGASAEAIDLSQVVEGQALTDVPKEVPLKPDSSISQVPFGATHMHGVSGSNGLEKLDVGDSQVAQVDDGSSPPNDAQAPSTPGSLGAERTNGASAEAIDLSQVVEGQALTDVPKEVPLNPDSSISQVPFGATHMHGVSGSNGLEKLDVGDSQVAQVDDGSSPPNDVQAPSTPGSLGAERTNGASAEAIDLSQVVEGQALTDVPKEVPLKPDSSISQVPFGATYMHGVSGSKGLEKLDVGDSQVAQVDDRSSPPNDVQAPSTPDIGEAPLPPIDDVKSNQAQALGEIRNGRVPNGLKPSELDGTVIDQHPRNVTAEQVEQRKPHLSQHPQPISARENVGTTTDDQEIGDSGTIKSQSPALLATTSQRGSVWSPQPEMKNRQPKSVTRTAVGGESLTNVGVQTPPQSPEGLVRSRVQIFEKLAGTSPQYLRKSVSPSTNSPSPRLPRSFYSQNNGTTDPKSTGSPGQKQSTERGTQSASKQDGPNELQEVMSRRGIEAILFGESAASSPENVRRV